MLIYFLIAVGSALGGMARYFAAGVVMSLTSGTFPYGTLFVNVTGAVIIGFFAALTGPEGRFFVPASGRMFVMTGFCGGYTTFSTFSFETMALISDGQWLSATANALLSVMLCLIAVWLGSLAARLLN